MFYPFLVVDPRSGLQYRLTDTGLAELSLAPKAPEWVPGVALPLNMRRGALGDISGTVQFPGVHCLPKRALLSASLCRGEAGCAGKSV